MNPIEFNIFFKDDFADLSGLVAESLYKGKISMKGSKGNLGQ